ncbi:hypothetical protein C8T65DRAFT_96204 [Cerioporus squamosus]|nr:hypothetical protein C8T65DRAFT_96204 [Cerioporus squamosus]
MPAPAQGRLLCIYCKMSCTSCTVLVRPRCRICPPSLYFIRLPCATTAFPIASQSPLPCIPCTRSRPVALCIPRLHTHLFY